MTTLVILITRGGIVSYNVCVIEQKGADNTACGGSVAGRKETMFVNTSNCGGKNTTTLIMFIRNKLQWIMQTGSSMNDLWLGYLMLFS